jgi:hypothetical protein
MRTLNVFANGKCLIRRPRWFVGGLRPRHSLIIELHDLVLGWSSMILDHPGIDGSTSQKWENKVFKVPIWQQTFRSEPFHQRYDLEAQTENGALE